MSNRYLNTTLRRALEKTAKEARIIAEDGARDAIRRLGVADSKAPSYLREDEKELRRRLRAHARALGDAFEKSDETQEVKRLVEAAAYAHWHRMLFTRFLAERGLLRNPEYDVPVSLEDCRELAEAEGLTDPWAIAERYAASMLPAVFRIDDPVLALQLDPAHTQKLNRLVTGLEVEVFLAEDSLGWTYQFWRAAEKDVVNASGLKIGADELPAVTQLFTEPYMVRFLLHNTLGAWWAGKVLAADTLLARSAANEEALRSACSLRGYRFDMLRFVRESEDGPWRPAAGTFPGWPNATKGVTVLDPCCGSGHFLTEALAILAALREAEEQLSSGDAVAAVLRDNLHGLEIDGRCVQIAAFAVALTAWRIGNWQPLPLPQIAWVGAPPPLPRREFIALADGDAELEYALAALHDLFAQAPVLGSLLEPSGGNLFEAERLKEVDRLIEPLLARARKAEPEVSEGIVAARGMVDALTVLRKRYQILVTNVPFLGRGKQDSVLSEYIEKRYPAGRQDLATAMFLKMLRLASEGGAIAGVSPQNWWYLTTYSDFRNTILEKCTLNEFCSLGSKSFQTPMWDFNVGLTIFTRMNAHQESTFCGLSVSDCTDAAEKEAGLQRTEISILGQSDQLAAPDQTISVRERVKGTPLANYAWCYQGISPGDGDRLVRNFWEIQDWSQSWNLYFTPPRQGDHFSGRSSIINRKALDGGETKPAVRGSDAWGKHGLIFGQMASLPFSWYDGQLFSNSSPVLVPLQENYLPAIAAYVASGKFVEDLRQTNEKLSVDNGYFVKVPFDFNHWDNIAKIKLNDGKPKQYSNDPANWLFHGHPADTLRGVSLHVALARTCGYRWPIEFNSALQLSENALIWLAKSGELPTGDRDGLLGVPPVAGEKSLADRLRAYLAAAFGSDWSDDLERHLIAEADKEFDKKVARDGSLEAWVRDRAFRQHCVLFGQRPFLWHLSDGLKDGFSVFVHYHRFDQANLRKLTYTLLGDWLARAKAENNALRYEKGRELQQMLEKVLEGEKPYDIFVRWKSLAHQPLGWDPDLDDGVRQNIRPFIKAGVLTHDLSKILKDKDRGNDVASAPWYSVFNGERRNDHHTTLADKRAAREAATVHSEGAK